METEEIIKKKSIIRKLTLFFVKPTELFRDYIEKPAWVLKLFLVSVITGVFTYGSKILGKDLFAEMMEEKAATMPPEQAEAVRASIPFMNSPAMNIGSAVGAALSMVVIILLVCLVYMAFIRMMKGKIKYKQVLSIYTLAYMASAIGLLCKLAFMYLTGNLLYIDVKPTITNALFNNLDPFLIWQAILMIFGISIVSGLPEKKSTVLVVGMWLVTLAISMGTVLLYK